MKLPKLLKKPIAKLKRAVDRTPKQTRDRSFAVKYNYTNVPGMAALEDRVNRISVNAAKKSKTIRGGMRAQFRLDRIRAKKKDIMLSPHKQKRLDKHERLRNRKDDREGRIMGEMTAFAMSQKPVDFGSKANYDKWQALRKAKKVSK